MKQIIFVVVLLCLCSLPALAVDLTFQWDAMPAGQSWSNVKLYELSAGTYTLKGTVAGTVTTYTVTGVLPGSHTYIVRSVAGTVESVDSNSVAKDIQPGAPSNFKIVMVDIAPDGTVTVKLVDPAEFFRS
jgi:hypothetical protein